MASARPRFSRRQRRRLKLAQERRVIRLPGRLSAAWIWASLALAVVILAAGVLLLVRLG